MLDAGTRRRVKNLTNSMLDFKDSMGGQLMASPDHFTVVEDETSAHAYCQRIKRWLKSVRELSREDGVLTQDLVEFYERLVAYNLTPDGAAQEIIFVRKFPVNPDNDASHEAALGLKEGVCARARDNIAVIVEGMFAGCRGVERTSVGAQAPDDDLAAILAEMNTPTQSELEEEFNSKSGYDDLF